jgi:hypothetical protein
MPSNAAPCRLHILTTLRYVYARARLDMGKVLLSVMNGTPTGESAFNRRPRSFASAPTPLESGQVGAVTLKLSGQRAGERRLR